MTTQSGAQPGVSPTAAGGTPPPPNAQPQGPAPPVGTPASPASPTPLPLAATTTPPAAYRPARPLAFFLWMSKTDIQGIGHCTYEAVATQAALGAMVCLTGLFAFSSSFFLVYSITEGRFSAGWLAPVLYAAAITTFDRELVGYTPSADLSLWEKILHLLPRLAFACVLGYAISIPMEHKLMEKAIEEEIGFEVTRTSGDLVKHSESVRADLDETRGQLKKDLEDARLRLSNVEQRLQLEYVQRGGKGPIYAGIEEERNRIQATVAQAQDDFTNFRPTPSQTEAMNEANVVIAARTRMVRADILKRTEALQRIRDRSPAADLLSRLVQAVFVLLELFPIILKLFMRYNEYHAYIELRRRIAIQKNHVLGGHALEFIDKYPAEAARLELTDLIQAAGEDSISSQRIQVASGVAALAGANPYAQMVPPAVGAGPKP